MKVRSPHPVASLPAAQLDLFERAPCAPVFVPDVVAGGDGSLTGYDFYFMLLPPREQALRVHTEALGLCGRLAIHKALMPAERLHHTLRQVHTCGVRPSDDDQQILEAALHAANGVAWRAVQVSMDRVAGGSEAGGHLLLRCTASSAGQIAALGSMLGRALRLNDLSTKAVVPHMTLVYGLRSAVQEQAITPIEWLATSFVLIASHRGVGHHQVLRSWPLAVPH